MPPYRYDNSNTGDSYTLPERDERLDSFPQWSCTDLAPAPVGDPADEPAGEASGGDIPDSDGADLLTLAPGLGVVPDAAVPDEQARTELEAKTGMAIVTASEAAADLLARPADSAAKPEWVAYALARGLSGEGTKAELIAAVDALDAAGGDPVPSGE